MSIRTIRIIQLVILVLPYFLIAILWNKIPDIIPTDWTSGALVPKMWHVFDHMLFPSTLLVCMLGSLYYYRNRSTTYLSLLNVFIAILLIFFTSNEVVRLLKMSGVLNLSADFSALPFAIYFILAGNFMSKMRSDYFGGYKFSWIKSNEQIWNKTHRMLAYIWVIGGLVMLVTICIPVIRETAWIDELLAAVLILLPILYSLVLYKRIKDLKPRV